MTPDEIRAASASDPDDAEVDVDWLRSHKVLPAEESADMFILVYDEQGRSAMRCVERVLPSTSEKSGYFRVVDDTGKSYRVQMKPQ